MFKFESKHISKVLPKPKLVKIQLEQGVFYFPGRLCEENPFRFRDLDGGPFLDAQEVVGIVPVVLSDSPIFFSYMIAVHMRMNPHAGVITTMKQVARKMMIPVGAKKVIAKVRSDCSKCKVF